MFKKYILPSGLRVVLVPQPQSLAATVLVLVEAGSNYETKEISGISHFLEHLCFKGTKKRPTALILTSELETLGAVYNAFTGNEVTGYYAKVGAEKIESALDIISDLYQNPVFDEKEMEKEKGVVIEEINLYEDMPMRKVQELFTGLLYGDQPAGWPIGGNKEIIRSLTKSQVTKYRGSHYVAKATVVAVAGNFDEKKIVKQINALFAGVRPDKKFSKKPVREIQKAPRQLVHYKESDQSHLVMGFRAFDRFDKRKYALEVFADVLGGGMSSRLFQRVREQLGAAYYVRSEIDLFTDHGFLSVAAGIDHQKLKIVTEAILDEFQKMVSQPVGDKELQKTKNHLTGKLVIGLETSDELATFYGEQEIFKEKITAPSEAIKRIMAVTSRDVLAVGRDIIREKGLNLALIGPFRDLPKDVKLRLR